MLHSKAILLLPSAEHYAKYDNVAQAPYTQRVNSPPCDSISIIWYKYSYYVGPPRTSNCDMPSNGHTPQTGLLHLHSVSV